MPALDHPSITFHVVVPVIDRPVQSNLARRFVETLRFHAECLTRGFVHVLAVDATRRRVWCAETGESIAGSRLATHVSRCAPGWQSPTRTERLRAFAFGSTGPHAAELCVLMNAAFFLADPPPVAALIARAAQEPTWC